MKVDVLDLDKLDSNSFEADEDIQEENDEDELELENLDPEKLIAELAEREEPDLDLVSLWLSEAGKKRRDFSFDEVVSLSQRMEQGDEDAKTKLIEANLLLVVPVAKRYIGRGVSFLDLLEEGNIGHIKGIEHFNYRRKCKISTCVCYWIRQEVQRAVAKQSRNVRKPVYLHDAIIKAKKIMAGLDYDPSAEELAELMEIKVPRAKAILKGIYDDTVYSLDARVLGESDDTLADFIEDEAAENPETNTIVAEIKRNLKKEISRLPTRQRDVLIYRYGFEDGCYRTLDEVGRILHLSRERVRQLQNKGINKLRRLAVAGKLECFL